jgi:SAM-dependent methyltransferase
MGADAAARDRGSAGSPERTCPCCTAPVDRRYLDTVYLRCEACGAFISTADAAGYEADYYYHAASAERSERRRGALEWRWFERVARARRPPIPRTPGRTAIEIGCSRGYFVETCLARGLAIRGYDVSAVALASARARGLGAICLQRDLIADNGASGVDAVDFVFAWEVLEHFDDPAAFLAAARRHMHPGGWLIGSTPNGQSAWIAGLGSAWHGFGIPQYHRIYFNPDALRHAFERSGFADVTTLTCVDWRSSSMLKHTATELAKKYLGTNDIRVRSAVALAVGPFEKLAELASGRVAGLNGETILFAARRAS